MRSLQHGSLHHFSTILGTQSIYVDVVINITSSCPPATSPPHPPSLFLTTTLEHSQSLSRLLDRFPPRSFSILLISHRIPFPHWSVSCSCLILLCTATCRLLPSRFTTLISLHLEPNSHLISIGFCGQTIRKPWAAWRLHSFFCSTSARTWKWLSIA